jgi:monoamine oxidase
VANVVKRAGHQVTLYEVSQKLGGQVLLAQTRAGRAESGGLATNLISASDW